MSYKESIEKASAELLSFIKQYELSTEKGPISDEAIKKIKDRICSFNDSSLLKIRGIGAHEQIFENDFIKVMNDFRKNEAEINERFTNNINSINSRYSTKYQMLNNTLKNNEHSCDREIESLEQDVTYYMIASSQSERVIEREYEQKVKRFDYQIASAKDTYNQNIKLYNDNLNQAIDSITVEFDGKLKEFDFETEKLIEKYNIKIEKAKAEYNKVESELNVQRNEMKEKFRKESIALNDSVRELLQKKNKSLDELRNEYNDNLANTASERDANQKAYQSLMQQTLKEFVFNMNELETQSNMLKDNNTKAIDNEYRLFYYKLLELNKRQNKELQKIMDDGTQEANGDYDRKTKALIKERNRNIHKLQNQAAKIRDKALKDINLSFQRSLEASRNDKALLDLDKTYSVKKITNQEQRDNKYYQELNNIHEIAYNTNVQIANLQYNQNANIVKTQSQIRSKDLEMKLDEIEATFQKKLEKILTKINGIKLEIDGAQHTSSALHEFETLKFQKELNFLSISNLLEIEKCKVLDQFNQRQYDNNVLNAKTILGYGKNKIYLENEKFKGLTKLKADKLKAQLAKDNLTTNYYIKEQELFENEEKNNVQRKTQYDIDTINHTVTNERFKGEYKNLQKKLSIFTLLLSELSSLIFDIAEILTARLNIRNEKVEMIKIFFSDCFKIINGYYKNLLNDYYEYELAIINSHHSFEESFKFHSYFTSLNTNYDTEKGILLNKKNSLTETIDTYAKTVEAFNGRIYSAQNQIQLLTDKKNKADINKEQLKEQLNQNTKVINESRKKIADISKLKANLEKDVVLVNLELKKAEDTYILKLKDIQEMQRNSAFSYYDLGTSLKKITKATTIKIDAKYALFQNKNYNEKSLVTALKNQIGFYFEGSKNLLEKLYETMAVFYNETTEAITNDNKLLLNTYNYDILSIRNSTRETSDAKKAEYLKKLSICDSDLKNLDISITNEENKYNNLLKNNDLKYDEDTKNIIKLKNKSIERFYTEFYAMCDNLNEIISDHDEDFKKINERFSSDKLLYNKNSIDKNLKLKQGLEDFIKAKDELINHLPTALKLQSQQLILETKNINLALSEDIKLAKQASNNERKQTQKKINIINLQLDQTLAENEILHQRDILKEKRIHNNKLKHIQKC